MSHSPQATSRSCPRCGQATTLSHCPIDGAETVVLSSFAKDALSYVHGDLVGGRYTILAPLGRGGFGAVYTAEHIGTGHQVAIKMLSADPKGVSPAVIQRFYREARITAQLTSSHTVRVFDVGQAEGGPLYLVMELLRGPTLDQVLRNLARDGKQMTEAVAIDLAVQMLRSLAEAHAAGLVHRDLKPANIILAQMGTTETVVKVLDFGIAHTQNSDLTEAGKTIGTPQYMSPEQFRGANLDGRSDLYALGVLLYRCVTGRALFDAESPYALMHAHLNVPATDPRDNGASDISVGFAACVMRLLAKDPNERYADAKALRLELESIGGGAWGGTPMVPYDVQQMIADAAAAHERPNITGTQPLDSNQVSALIEAGTTHMSLAAAAKTDDAAGGDDAAGEPHALAAMATHYWQDDDPIPEEELVGPSLGDADRPMAQADVAQADVAQADVAQADVAQADVAPSEPAEQEFVSRPPAVAIVLLAVGLLACGLWFFSDNGAGDEVVEAALAPIQAAPHPVLQASPKSPDVARPKSPAKAEVMKMTHKPAAAAKPVDVERPALADKQAPAAPASVKPKAVVPGPAVKVVMPPHPVAVVSPARPIKPPDQHKPKKRAVQKPVTHKTKPKAVQEAVHARAVHAKAPPIAGAVRPRPTQEKKQLDLDF